jgi:predicted kinase
MITAMQMMLDDLISKREAYENASMHHSVATLETSIELAEYLLEKEKEQIIDAYNHNMTGFDKLEQEEIGLNWAEEYFNKTYKNQAP